jgi:hypothetical protein
MFQLGYQFVDIFFHLPFRHSLFNRFAWGRPPPTSFGGITIEMFDVEGLHLDPIASHSQSHCVSELVSILFDNRVPPKYIFKK